MQGTVAAGRHGWSTGGSPVWTHFELSRPNWSCDRTLVFLLPSTSSVRALTRVLGGYPGWTRLELAREAGIASGSVTQDAIPILDQLN